MRLTMYLNLLDGSKMGWVGNSLGLYTRHLNTDMTPTPGIDEVVLWPGADDHPTDGPMWSCRRRYLDAYGGWHLDLTSMVINPHDAARETISRSIGRSNVIPYRAWYTETDGNPFDHLYDAGWRIYGDKPS